MKKNRRMTIATLVVGAAVSASVFALPAAANAGGFKGCGHGQVIQITSSGSKNDTKTIHSITGGTSVATGGSYSRSWTYKSGTNHTTKTGAISGTWEAQGNPQLEYINATCVKAQ